MGTDGIGRALVCMWGLNLEILDSSIKQVAIEMLGCVKSASRVWLLSVGRRAASRGENRHRYSARAWDYMAEKPTYQGSVLVSTST